MNKISAVYKIVNTITGDSYVGSSKDVKQRWANHKCPSRWKECPNKLLYQDMQKYGIDKFRFQILAPVIPEYLAQIEQEFIDMLQPTYNNANAKGWNVERTKERNKRFYQTEKGKDCIKRYHNKSCSYNGETLTLNALAKRFRRRGIEYPYVEARKYLIIEENK